jgi:hypothetical protein
MTSRIARRVLVAVVLAALASGCDDAPLLPPDELRGTWGGEGFGLEVSLEFAAALLTCAYGELETPIPLGADGRFAAPGAYVREVGPAALRNPASYEGRVQGETLELSVVVTDTIGSGGTHTLGPFVGTRGGTPVVFHCQ